MEERDHCEIMAYVTLWYLLLPIKGVSMAHKSVKLSESLLELAISDAENSMRSTPMQIEYYYRLGRLAEQYDDLPISMIKSLMVSMKEKADIPFSFSR